MELLNAKHPGIPPTLRDDRLKEEVKHPLMMVSCVWFLPDPGLRVVFL
jgi:hypothetical protein